MTSVQNRRRPLSGSRFFICWIVLACFSACSSSKGVTVREPTVLTPDKTPTEEKSSASVLQVDTVRWTLVSDPPITSDMALTAELPISRKNTYEVALLIPFRSTGEYNTVGLDANKQKFAHFYAGMKQAMEERQLGNVSINITTYDTNRSKANFERIIDRMSRYKPDLIVGPYETDLIAEAAEFAKSNRIPLISPWRASTRITSDNPYYLQLRPNITEYYSKIVEHIDDHFDKRTVRVIGRKTGEDNAKIRAIQELNETESDLPLVEPYLQFLVDEDSLMVADSTVFDAVFEKDVQVFFLPQFSARDEGFLYSCMRKLYAEKGDRDIYIYAMPLALNSDRVDINILKNLNLRVCEYRFTDLRNPVIQAFRQKYFDAYGWLPTDDSYFGFDVMKLIFYGLEKYGQYFHYYLAGERVDLSQMSVYIEPYYRKPNTERMDYMMNSHLSIIAFENDHFTIKNIR